MRAAGRGLRRRQAGQLRGRAGQDPAPAVREGHRPPGLHRRQTRATTELRSTCRIAPRRRPLPSWTVFSDPEEPPRAREQEAAAPPRSPQAPRRWTPASWVGDRDRCERCGFPAPAPEGLGVALIGVPSGAELDLDLRLESVMEGVLVSGTATMPLTGECGRCLEPVSDELAVDLQELFAYAEGDADDDEDDRTDGGRPARPRARAAGRGGARTAAHAAVPAGLRRAVRRVRRAARRPAGGPRARRTGPPLGRAARRSTRTQTSTNQEH